MIFAKLVGVSMLVMAFVVIASAMSSIEAVCKSEACEREATLMLSKINDSAGICDNFFDFACGNYKPEIPNHKVKIDELALIQDTLQERLNEVMKSPVVEQDIQPFRNVKVFYQSCVNKGESRTVFWQHLELSCPFPIDMIGKLGLDPIKSLLTSMGGWPVILESWDETSWSWQEMVIVLETIGFPSNFLFELSVTPNQKNTSTRILGVNIKSLSIVT